LQSLRYISIYTLTAAVLTVAVVFSCQASEQTRRFPLELEIVAANAHAILSPTIPARQKHALKIRIASSLGTLRFLAREYLQAQHLSDTDLLGKIDALRLIFKSGMLQRFAIMSDRLAQQYPAELSGLQPADAKPNDIKAGQHIYQRLCMGCHEHPDSSQASSAQDLFTMAKTQPQGEFIARLVCGVHGTPAVALRNPFSDSEIAGLAAYLLQGKHPH
jgi:mono/diheme cytochrome c family protein